MSVTAVWPWSDMTTTAYRSRNSSNPPAAATSPPTAASHRSSTSVGRVRAGGVRGVVVVREVEEQEVEAVARHEPASDGGRVRVDRPRRPVAEGERRAGPLRAEEVVEVEALGAAHRVEERNGGSVQRAAAVGREVDRRGARARRPRAPRRSSPRRLPRCSAFMPTSVSRSVRPSPAARAAPNDDPYSTSRRSSRCHHTRCGISWTSGWAPVAIEERHTGVSDGNVVVARASVPCSASAVRVGSAAVPSEPSSIDGVSPSITTRTSFLGASALLAGHFASVRSPACRSGSFRARRAASGGNGHRQEVADHRHEREQSDRHRGGRDEERRPALRRSAPERAARDERRGHGADDGAEERSG